MIPPMWVKYCLPAGLAPLLFFTACQTTTKPPKSDLSSELDAQARGVGYASAAMMSVTALDPTGVSSYGAMAAGASMRSAMMKNADKKLREKQKLDEQEMYKRYGMNPDGTPSGKPGPGSDAAASPEG